MYTVGYHKKLDISQAQVSTFIKNRKNLQWLEMQQNSQPKNMRSSFTMVL